MNTALDCIPCFLRQALDAARGASESARVHELVVRDALHMAAAMDLAQPPPSLAQALHRRLRALTGVSDAYQHAKRRFNRLALEALPDLSDTVRRAEDPLLAAAKCAVAANAIDMGITSSITDDEVRTVLRGCPEDVAHPRWEQFREAVARAGHILYLADNAGEIAIDRLVIQELGPSRVTVVVRGAPVLNDATIDDAREVGLCDLTEVIDNGSDAPGTILADCSGSFRDRFDQADLVIAKGQGNFETLSGVEKRIAFWFKVKCPLVSQQVGLLVGSHALLPPQQTWQS